MIRQFRLIALSAATILQGCASTGFKGTVMHGVSSSPIVRIVNENPRTMRVYLRSGAATISLGTVPGLDSRQFLVPRGSFAAKSEVYLEASERGGSSNFRSESFSLNEGRAVWWTLNHQRANSLVVK
jgi:hypothetical protein